MLKTLYNNLRTSIPEIPFNCKDFQGFNASQLNTACQILKINGYIFVCELTDGATKAASIGKWLPQFGCLNLGSEFVEGGLHLNMLCFNDHLIYIKNLKSLFNQ